MLSAEASLELATEKGKGKGSKDFRGSGIHPADAISCAQEA